MKQIMSLRDILKLSKNTQEFSEECSVILADAKELTFLKGLYVNKVCQNLLGYDSSELRNFSIKKV